MRITSGSYYNNIYGENNKINTQLFDVNKQISSGLKIQYAHEDPTTFINTLRLDNELTTLGQVKDSTNSAYKFSTQTDTTIGDIVKTLETMKVKLLNATNDTQSDTSRQAIAKELRGLQNNLLSLANSSIGGQYLFAGTATSVQPIDSNYNYQGNANSLDAFLGSGIKQIYNISGAQLFLGEENIVNRTVTTNVANQNLTDLYGLSKETYITPTSTIGDLMGNSAAGITATSHFYVQGTKSNGDTFKTKISLNPTDTVNDLMAQISNAYGSNQVDVSLNSKGQIEIKDKITGSSKLDFHMVGATDYNPAGLDDANVTNIDLLQVGTTDFANVKNATNLLYVKEFTKSGFVPSNVANSIEGINYDRTNFKQDGAQLVSNISQIDKSSNAFATPSSKLVDIAGANTLNAQQLNLVGTNIHGAAFNAQINLSTAGSTFSLDGGVTNYNIFTATAPRAAVDADKMTYQQLLDVVNMAVSGNIPAGFTATDYDNAITASNTESSTILDNSGRMVIKDKMNPTTPAKISIYDNNSSDYSITTGAVLSFNANSALSVRDPKNNFFAQIDEMIKSVEEGKTQANGVNNGDPRNIGMQNSIKKIDDLSDHISRLQTLSGSYSQVLQTSSDRTDLLITSTKSLQSDVVDTDMAEAQLRLQQLTLNYQAMLSNISKVSKLSLVNYM